MAVFTAIYTTLAAVFTLYSTISMVYYFYYFGKKGLKPKESLSFIGILKQCFDKHSELNKRSSILNLISGVGLATVAIDGWLFLSSGLDSPWHYDCVTNLLVKYTAWIWALYGFSARAFRLYLQIYVNNERKQGVFGVQRRSEKDSDKESSHFGSIAAPSTDQMFLLSQSDKDDRLSRIEYYAQNERYFVFAVTAITVLATVLNVLVGLPKGYYDPYNPSRIGCNTGESYYVVWGFIGIYIFFLSPYLLYCLRKGHDAYYLQDGIMISIKAGAPAYILYFGLQFGTGDSDLKKNVNPVNIPYLVVCAIHFFVFVMPIIKDAPKSTNLTRTYASFVETLAEHSKYEKLRECAAEEFSTENTMFWESFMTLMRRSFHELARHVENSKQDLKSIPGLTKQGYPMLRDIQHLKSELVKYDSVVLPSLYAAKSGNTENTTEIRVPMKYSVASAYVKLFEYFISIGSQYELNILNTERKSIEPLILALAKRLDDMDATTTNEPATTGIVAAARKKNDPELKNVYLVFHDGTPQDFDSSKEDLEVSVHVFDNIKDGVLSNIYENTFVRLLNRKQKDKMEKADNNV